MLREDQVTQIAEYTLEHVPREDYAELVEALPAALEKAYQRANTVKKQPRSTWQHYLNWHSHAENELLKTFASGMFLLWAVFFSVCAVVPLLAPLPLRADFVVSRWAMTLLLSTLILLIIPQTMVYLSWRRWHAGHPVEIHQLWSVEDYIN